MPARKKKDDAVVAKGPRNMNSFHVWAFGICMSVGGQYIGWNKGLSGGVGSFLIAATLTASAYACLLLCIAEISSALPFAGGSYGIARVTLGIFPGYLIACFDSLESILYAAEAVFMFAHEITVITELHYDWEILTWVVVFLVTVSIQLVGDHFMWHTAVVLAVVSISILLLYIAASAKDANFEEYAAFKDSHGDNKWFHGGMTEYMHIAPLASWLFVGVESINLACKDVKSPKTMIPKGYFWCMTTLFVMAILVVFFVSSTYPGLSHHIDELNPLDAGFQHVFKISYRQAAFLSLPATYAVCFGFSVAFSRQLRSMSASGILNPWLQKSTTSTNAPYAALFAGWAIVFAVIVIAHFEDHLAKELYDISMLFAYSAYIAQLLGFIMFRRTLGNIKKLFKNPLGEYAAYWAIFVFSMNVVSILAFQDDQTAVVVYAVIVCVATLYYFAVVKKRQYFSTEEQQVLFVAHVQKNNAEKRRISNNKRRAQTPFEIFFGKARDVLPEGLQKFLPGASTAVRRGPGGRSISRTNGAQTQSSLGQISVGSDNTVGKQKGKRGGKSTKNNNNNGRSTRHSIRGSSKRSQHSQISIGSDAASRSQKQEGTVAAAQQTTPSPSSSSSSASSGGWVDWLNGFLFIGPTTASSSAGLTLKNNKVSADLTLSNQQQQHIRKSDGATPSVRRAAKEQWAQKAAEKAKAGTSPASAAPPSLTNSHMVESTIQEEKEEEKEEDELEREGALEGGLMDASYTTLLTDHPPYPSFPAVSGAGLRVEINSKREKSDAAATNALMGALAPPSGGGEYDLEASEQAESEDDNKEVDEEEAEAEEGEEEANVLDREGRLSELASEEVLEAVDLSQKQLKAVLCTCNNSLRHEPTIDAMILRSISHSHSIAKLERERDLEQGVAAGDTKTGSEAETEENGVEEAGVTLLGGQSSNKALLYSSKIHPMLRLRSLSQSPRSSVKASISRSARETGPGIAADGGLERGVLSISATAIAAAYVSNSNTSSSTMHLHAHTPVAAAGVRGGGGGGESVSY